MYSGQGLIKVNGKPLHLVEPQILRFKVYEPVLLVGLDKFGMHNQDTENMGQDLTRTNSRR
jgi:ribosomal protein S9